MDITRPGIGIEAPFRQMRQNPPVRKNPAAIQRLAKLIHGIDVAMLTTVVEDGKLRSRPMATQKHDFDGTLWFYTKLDAPKSIEIQEDQRVNVSFAEPREQRFVSVSGEAELVRDRKRVEQYWHPDFCAWFPEGLDDPDLVLVKVEVSQAEYWDASTSRMVHLLGLSRQRPAEHEKIDLAG